MSVPINADSHVHIGVTWIFILTLDMHVRVCPATGFCSTSTATWLSATNVPLTFFYSKAYFLDFSTSITSLQTNPAIFRLLGSCSPGYIIILFPQESVFCANTKHNNMNPIQASCYLTTYIGRQRGGHALALLLIRYLPNLLNMTSVVIVVILINFLRESPSPGWPGWWSRALCSLLNGIFYSNIRYNFVLTIKSSCLLHICSVLQGLVWLKPWPKVLKSGGTFSQCT